MDDPYEHLRKVDFLRDLPEEDLDALCTASEEVALADGDTLFEQGDAGDAAYVITSGALEIVRSGTEADTLLALREPGEVIGEMALLQDEPRMATARARGTTTVLKVPKPAMADLLEVSPTAVRGLFDILLERLRATQALMRQNERMAQLGTLTAGVAHELNNPAAAVQRSASQLEATLDRVVRSALRGGRELDADVVAGLDLLTTASTGPVTLSAIERRDREQAVERTLADAGIDESWLLAADLVDAGVGAHDLDGLDPDDLPAAVALIAEVAATRVLTHSIVEAADRLSSIVGALRSYSFLDRAPVQEVDVRKGIEDTLLILGDKLRGIVVERDYADDLRVIEARGAELNQVWTNLLDNAADAILDRRATDGDAVAGRIVIGASNTPGGIAVEITDDGPGIPDGIVERIFDSFFTTKGPGHGTGLGLDVSWQIVAVGHGGTITVDSRPGATCFRVELPLAHDRSAARRSSAATTTPEEST